MFRSLSRCDPLSLVISCPTFLRFSLSFLLFFPLFSLPDSPTSSSVEVHSTCKAGSRTIGLPWRVWSSAVTMVCHLIEVYGAIRQILDYGEGREASG